MYKFSASNWLQYLCHYWAEHNDVINFLQPSWINSCWGECTQGVNFMSCFYKQNCFVQLFFYYSLALQCFVEIILAQKTNLKCWWNGLQVSISPSFYKQLFNTKLFCAFFYVLAIKLCNFMLKEYWKKAAHIMLVLLIKDWSTGDSPNKLLDRHIHGDWKWRSNTPSYLRN